MTISIAAVVTVNVYPVFYGNILCALVFHVILKAITACDNYHHILFNGPRKPQLNNIRMK